MLFLFEIKKDLSFHLSLMRDFINGAGDENRTRMGFPTRPSNVRVYQFHHPGEQQHNLYSRIAFSSSTILKIIPSSLIYLRLEKIQNVEII